MTALIFPKEFTRGRRALKSVVLFDRSRGRALRRVIKQKLIVPLPFEICIDRPVCCFSSCYHGVVNI